MRRLKNGLCGTAPVERVCRRPIVGKAILTTRCYPLRLMHDASNDSPTARMPSSAAAKRGCFPVLLVVVLAAIAIWSVFTSGGPELKWHNDDKWSAAIGLGLGLLCFAVMIGTKSRTGRTVGGAVACSLLIAVVALPVSGVALDRLHEIADFHATAAVDRIRNLPIDSAAVRHGQAGTILYVVGLTDLPTMLGIDKRDYLAAFGQAVRVRPRGYCVHVVVRTAGKASRVLDEERRDLPVGSLVRCT